MTITEMDKFEEMLKTCNIADKLWLLRKIVETSSIFVYRIEGQTTRYLVSHEIDNTSDTEICIDISNH